MSTASVVSPQKRTPIRNPKLGYPIFDIEVHCSHARPEEVSKYLPQRYRERFNQRYLGLGMFNFDQRGGGLRTDGDVPGEEMFARDAATVRKYLLEPYDIEWAICTGQLYCLGILPDVDYAAAIASAYNDWMIHDFIPQDPRFLVAISISPSDPAQAIREIERWADHPRVVEIMIPSASTIPLGNRFFHPIYEAAQACGLPIAAHTTNEGKGISPAPTVAGYPSRYLEFHTGLAANAIAQTASLVCEGVFAKFPNFQFLLMEGGISWVLPLMWQLDADWKRLKQEMPLLKEKPSDYLKRQFFYTTQPIEEPKSNTDLLHLYEQVGGHTQIMFSSDFPHWDFDNPFKILPGQTAADLKRRILRENARRLFAKKIDALEAEEA